VWFEPEGIGKWFFTDLIGFVPHCLKYGLHRPLTMWLVEVPKAALVLALFWWAFGGWMLAGLGATYVVMTFQGGISVYQHMLWDKDAGDDHYYKGTNTLMVGLRTDGIVNGQKNYVANVTFYKNEKVHWPYELAEMCHGMHHVAPTIKNFEQTVDGTLLGREWVEGEPVMNPKLTFVLPSYLMVTAVICGRTQDWQMLADRNVHNLNCAPEDRLPPEVFHKMALHCFST
jgi:hypothetical protein